MSINKRGKKYYMILLKYLNTILLFKNIRKQVILILVCSLFLSVNQDIFAELSNKPVKSISSVLFSESFIIAKNTNFDINDIYAIRRQQKWKAFLIAFGPGYIFHGLGDYYMGYKAEAAMTFLFEILSIFIVICGRSMQDSGSKKGNEGDQFFGGLLELCGHGLFYTSWFMDMFSVMLPPKLIDKKYSTDVLLFNGLSYSRQSNNLQLNLLTARF